MAAQRYLILIRATPYGSHQSRAAIDVALTAAAFEQQVSVVFLDDGVLQLQGGQDTQASGMKNVGNMLPALHLYDVEAVYCHAPSAQAHGMTARDLPADVSTIENAGLKALLASADQVMVF